eukprot:2356325-Pleurochrysis_carterae.AAC.1
MDRQSRSASHTIALNSTWPCPGARTEVKAKGWQTHAAARLLSHGASQRVRDGIRQPNVQERTLLPTECRTQTK